MATQAADALAGVNTTRGKSSRLRALDLNLYLPLGVLVLMVLACFFGPSLFHIVGPNEGSLLNAQQPIGTPGHILGTDPIGNDVLSRCLFGGRASLEVGVGAVLLGALIGGVLGVLGGFKGGSTESVIMRVLDMFLAFPTLILVLVIATYLGPSERNLIFAIAFFTIPANARLARAETLRVRGRDYVIAARYGGRSEAAIVRRHIVPNVLPVLMTFGFLGVAIAMIAEASLSFLGLGIPPPAPSWGGMIATGQQYLAVNPALVLIPAGFLFVTVMSLNLVGDALRKRWSEA